MHKRDVGRGVLLAHSTRTSLPERRLGWECRGIRTENASLELLRVLASLKWMIPTSILVWAGESESRLDFLRFPVYLLQWGYEREVWREACAKSTRQNMLPCSTSAELPRPRVLSIAQGIVVLLILLVDFLEWRPRWLSVRTVMLVLSTCAEEHDFKAEKWRQQRRSSSSSAWSTTA